MPINKKTCPLSTTFSLKNHIKTDTDYQRSVVWTTVQKEECETEINSERNKEFSKMKKFNASMVVLLTILMFCGTSLAYDFQYLPFFLQTKNARGETLASAIDKVYAGRIYVKDGRCHFFESQYRANDKEYEIDRCRLNFNQDKIYSEADRLNGVKVKARIWVEGNSYRTRTVGGEWSRWQDSQMFASVHWGTRTGMNVRLENGQFYFTLDKNLTLLHVKPGPVYVPESKSSNIRQPERQKKGKS